MLRKFFKSIPIWRTPKQFFASLNSANLCFIVSLTGFMLFVLNGKIKCFSVLAAELQNVTCNSINDTCGMATLNWIAFLSETIIVGSSPFITNMLIRTHSGVLGGRITFQFTLLLILGTLLTNFVTDPESLFVTDTLIQGCATAVLLSIVSFKLAHTFPEDHVHHRMTLLLTELIPWAAVIFCPLYAYLIITYNWSTSYLLIGLLILIICTLAGILDPRATNTNLETQSVASSNDYDNKHIRSSDNQYEPRKVEQSDYWDIDETLYTNFDGECHHPSLMQLLLNANMSVIISRPLVVAWFIERAVAIVAEYNLLINVVHYMISILSEPLIHGSTILITLGVGYIMGFIIVYTLGIGVRRFLPHIYLGATVLLIVSFVVWQIYGSQAKSDIFTVTDAHSMIIVIGILSAMTNAQSYNVAEDIIERPKIVSVSLTKLAQAIGLLIGPITSGMLIQIDTFNSFFSVQAFLHCLRILLLAFIIYKKTKLDSVKM